MDGRKRTSLVNRILAGGYFVEILNDLYFLDFRFDSDFKTYVDYLYDKNYEIAQGKGLITKDERLKAAIRNGEWSSKNEYLIEKYKKDLDEFKKEYYKSIYNNKRKGKIKEEYEKTKKTANELLQRKHLIISEGTCENYCNSVTNRCRYSKMVKYKGKDKKDILDTLSFSFINYLELSIYESSIKEEEMRELSRTNPWRTLWVSGNKNTDSIFGISVASMSEEQKEICYWSSYYDNVYEAYERPSNEIIEDDLAIDGWYLVKAEEREREVAKRAIEQKAGDSKEIFVVTDAENAKKIYEMNDPQVRSAMKKRDNLLKEKNVVTEQELVKHGGITTAGLFVEKRKK